MWFWITFSGRKKNVASHLRDGHFRLVEGDIQRYRDVQSAIDGVEAVFHLAAVVSVPFSVKKPLFVNDVNLNGTLNVLDACVKSGVRRFVYASSCAVYGEPVRLPIDEEHPTRLLSPYGVSKLAAEHYCRVFYELYGLETVCLRFFNVYGVIPCGSTIGFKGDVTWRIMDSLGLKYMEGYGMPEFKVNCFVFPTHLSLDIHYVRNFGEKEGYQKFKEDLLQQLSQNGIATVLVHPEGFVRSVQSHGLLKIPLTLLRKGMMKSVYENFLCEFRDKVGFKKYVDMC